MAIRQDKIQLFVEINGKRAGGSLKELQKQARDLKRAMDNAQDPAQVAKYAAELKKVNDVLAQNRSLTKGVADNMNELRVAGIKLPGIFQKVGGAISGIGIIALIAGIRQLFISLRNVGSEAIDLFDKQAKVDAQQKAVLKSTNEAAGRSFEQLKQQAKDLQNLTLFSDQQIQGAQNILLTFTQVREEIADRALPTILDISTALGSDLKGASIQLGKALNDPIAGVSALAEVGVSFSAQQKQVIKDLVETGQVAKAQSLILDELAVEFGGSAEAAAKAGRGGYQQLSNRLNDVKENAGLLIDRGLNFLKPAISATLTITEKFVGAVVSGEKATGRFSGVVNFLAGGVKVLGTVFSAVGNIISQIGPTFAGVSAAAKQGIDNIKAQFESAKASAEIFAKRLQLAFTLDGNTREQLKKEIAGLQQLKDDAATSGKSIGEAFSEARNKALLDAAADQAASEASIGDLSVKSLFGGQSEPEVKKKIEDRVNKEFEAKLKGLEAGYERENLLLEQQRIKKEVTDGEYNQKQLDIQQTYYESQLKAFDDFGKSQENKAIEIQNKLLEVQQQQARGSSGITTFKLKSLQQGSVSESTTGQQSDAEAQAERDQQALRERFLRALITEQEYNESLREMKLAAYEEQLEILRLAGEAETEQFRAIQLQKLEIEKELNDERIANAQRTEQAREEIARAGFQATRDVFGLATELLGEDVKKRQKYASIVKTLEISNVLLNTQSEVSSIWANAQKAPAAQLLGPAAGTALAIIQTTAALARSGVAISKINATQFYRGGRIPRLSGQRINESPNIPEQPGGDNIFAMVRAGEVVLNERQQALAGGPALFRRIGVPGFMDGGLIDTTPTVNTNTLLAGVGDNNDNSALITEFRELKQVFASFPKVLKANVVYQDVEDAGSELEQIRNQADI